MLYDELTEEQLLRSIEAEAAKAIAEMKCLRRDAEQIDARLKFIISIIHHLKDRIE